MKVKFYLAMALAALLMTNCSQEESLNQSKGSTNVLTATIEGASSRSTVTDGGVFSWSVGDAIAVGNSSNEFTGYVYGADGKFTSETSITPTGYAIYPFNAHDGSWAENALPTIKLAGEYTYGSTNAPMLATIEEGSNTLHFKHLAGLMRFRVKNVPAGASTFTLTTDGKDITGEFTPEAEGEVACIKAGDNDTYDEVMITFESVEDVMDFYVPMPVGEYGKLKVTIGGKSLESTNGVTNEITRGKLLLMPTMAFVDGALKLEGGNNVSLKANEEVNLEVNAGEELVVDIADGAEATLNLDAPASSTLTITDGSGDTESSADSKGTLNISSNASILNINTPTLTVKLTEGEYDKVVALTAQETLIIGEGVTIGELVLNGGNVKLEGDLALTKPLVVGIETTIDLNGHILSGVNNTGQGYLIIVENGATLTVKDESDEKNGKITYAQGTSNVGWAVDLEGNLNLESGTIELTGDSWSIGYAVDVRPNSWGKEYQYATTFNMTGGKLLSSDGAIRVASSSSESHKKVAANFNMTGGEIVAVYDGIFIQQSNETYDVLNVKIEGGTLKSDTYPIRLYGPVATGYVGNSSLTISGGVFSKVNVDGKTELVEDFIYLGRGIGTENIYYTKIDITDGKFDDETSISPYTYAVKELNN